MTSHRRAAAARLAALVAMLALTVLPAEATSQRAAQRRGPRTGGSLEPFESDSALAAYLRGLAAERIRIRAEELARWQAAVEAGEIQPGAQCPNGAVVSRAGAPAQPSGEVPTGPAILRGRVRSAEGTPIAAAQVTMAAFGLGVTTTAGGDFLLVVPEAKLPTAQPVALLVRRIGYTAQRTVLSLAPGDSVRVDVHLCSDVVQLEASVTASPGEAWSIGESITNVQHEGVDEGGIVKTHGDHLVILRRGRLFTIRVGDRSLRPVDAVDAFGPGIDPSGDWYDELLVSGDRIVVVGYSYERGGTELGLFRIDRRGRLRHEATHHLRSNDYYSSRNYASRLVGTTLVFYTPLGIPIESEDALSSMPAIRRWHRAARPEDFRPILAAERVYRPARPVDPMGDVTLHTITTCDLAAATAELSCSASAVIGPQGRVFYVSPSAVYVWVSDWVPRRWLRGRVVVDTTAMRTAVYRLPLDGSAPSALGVTGSPVDQFSFLESPDGHLNVLVRSDAAGDGMWSAELASGRVALLRVPLWRFGDGDDDAPPDEYRELPAPDSVPRHDAFVNRFVGAYLLYGTGSGWWKPRDAPGELHVVPWQGGEITRLDLPHGVDRIEALGEDAVVVGAREDDLHFSGIGLGARPSLVQRYVLRGASQGELRSHGFFYRFDEPDAGILGLPVMGPGRRGSAHLFDEAASMLFLRNADGRFRALGELEPHAELASDDGCRASCVDWYGDARPIFWRGRVFALLGYELVEGALVRDRIREVRRADFAPRVARTVGR